jgi:ADP-ribose pyrophosphatase YjhB (NUDIX family)
MAGIRALAVAVPVARGRVLVERGHERATGRRFYRAIGGGIEFGERAIEALEREWREEYDLTLADVRLLGVAENFFTYEGRPGHEIVFVHAARVVEPWVHERDAFETTEPDGLRHEAVWVPFGELASGGVPLHPEGILAMLGRGP